jgi:hypothetical protein
MCYCSFDRSLTIVTANGKVKEFTPDDGEEWEAAM